MSGRIIRLARWGMQPELEKIWQVCFGDPRRPVAYFFNNAFQPRACLVYEIDGRAAAMVHMLPVRMAQPGGEVRGHYMPPPLCRNTASRAAWGRCCGPRRIWA